MSASNHPLVDYSNLIRSQLRESEYDLSLLKGVLLGQGYIVVTASGFPLDFTCVNQVVNNPKIAPYAGRVLRMTRSDAERVAAQVKDGANRGARAIHVLAAVMDEIDARKAVLASLDDTEIAQSLAARA